MKTICPVCQENLNVTKSNLNKVVVCDSCTASLFIGDIKDNRVEVLPFEINTPEFYTSKRNTSIEDKYMDFEEDEF